MKQQVAILISGTGSNASRLMSYFKENEHINICGLLSSKENASLSSVCAEYSIPFVHLTPTDAAENYITKCKQWGANWIVLAGFLKKIPVPFIAAFPDRILNIHPSLLPNYGGKGMYGHYVHQAVAKAQEAFSGISIHLVNEEFDKGKLLFQHAVALPKGIDAEGIEKEVRALEAIHFAADLETYILSITE
ncbi:MAG: hypothetical protein RLZZ301_416 [Bacteroidota bacterium]|jgi:phosphoribosylglycinamide formyltransferase-1